MQMNKYVRTDHVRATMDVSVVCLSCLSALITFKPARRRRLITPQPRLSFVEHQSHDLTNSLIRAEAASPAALVHRHILSFISSESFLSVHD